jgi:hypothetical protein
MPLVEPTPLIPQVVLTSADVIGDLAQPAIEGDSTTTEPVHAPSGVDINAALALFRVTGETITTPEQDKADIETVKAANPGVQLYLCFVDDRLYLFRPMNEEEYETILHHGGVTMKAVVKACMLLPSEGEFEVDLKHHAALRHVFGVNLVRIAGSGDPQYTLKMVA